MQDQTETQSGDKKESWFDLLWNACDVIADLCGEGNLRGGLKTKDMK
jgi:hypothetical protein